MTGRLIRSGRKGARGFTFIELMVVLSIIAVLASIAIPRFMHSALRAREAALMEDLFQMREAIDKYYADHGKYPQSIEDVADSKYIRAIPVDPITESKETWVEVPTDDGEGVFDVRSGSDETGRNGIPYNEW